MLHAKASRQRQSAGRPTSDWSGNQRPSAKWIVGVHFAAQRRWPVHGNEPVSIHFAIVFIERSTTFVGCEVFFSFFLCFGSNFSMAILIFALFKGATGCKMYPSVSIQCCSQKAPAGADSGIGSGADVGGVPAAGVALIKEFEGLHLSAYPDPKSGGLPITIGYGSTR